MSQGKLLIDPDRANKFNRLRHIFSVRHRYKLNSGDRSFQLSPLTLGLIVPLLFLTGCNRAEESANAQQEQVIPVKIESIRQGLVDHSDDFIASLVSRQSVELKSRVSGQIDRIYVKAGDQVTGNTLLIQIDASEQIAAVTSSTKEIESAVADLNESTANVQEALAELSRSRATLANTKATLEDLKAERVAKVADLKLAEKNYKRYSSLKKSGAVSEETLDNFSIALDSAHATLNSLDAKIKAQESLITAQEADIEAQAARVKGERAVEDGNQKKIETAQANTEQAKAQLLFYSIKAPFSGTIGDIPVKVGDIVSTDTALATLTKNDELEVNLQVPIEKATKLSQGMEIEILDASGKQLATSRISFISPKTDPVTQSVLIKASLPNSLEKLRADQFIKARAIWQRTNSLLVPKTAIIPIAGQNFIYVVEEKEGKLTAKQRSIEVGTVKGNDQQVINGLNPSDRIVTSGIQKITDGVTVVAE
jgi:RND family efflux transporter MFP subunit